MLHPRVRHGVLTIDARVRSSLFPHMTAAATDRPATLSMSIDQPSHETTLSLVKDTLTRSGPSLSSADSVGLSSNKKRNWVAARRNSGNTVTEAALGWAPFMRLLDGMDRTHRWIHGDCRKRAR